MIKPKDKTARIIGSGIAGIASAIRLAVRGYHVHIHEKNSYPGGKLTVVEGNGFRFDAGPSLFTMPHFVDELFALANKNPADYFQYAEHPIAAKYFFEDGKQLYFYTDEEALKTEIEKQLNVSADPLLKHLEKSAYIYKKTHKTFLEMSLHKYSNFLSWDVLESIAAIPNLGLFSTMHDENAKSLNHPHLIQIYDRYATYNGSNPYRAPGILNVIPHLEHGFGTFFPKGGMHSIPSSLLCLAKDLGVELHLNSPVEEILSDEDGVSGIVSKGISLPADVVVCNADIRPAYKHLLRLDLPAKVQREEPSTSAMIFYWGISKKFPELDLHNLFFTSDYKNEFNQIQNAQAPQEDPTVYIHCSSRCEPEDAPSGKDNWFVMVNVPPNSGQDWDMWRTEIRRKVLQKLERMMGVSNLESLIEFEDYLDPPRIEQRTSSHAGALYGSSSNDRMAAFFRHPNFSKTKGLHFVGGSVHPGGGIPLCLLSAKIAVDTVKD